MAFTNQGHRLITIGNGDVNSEQGFAESVIFMYESSERSDGHQRLLRKAPQTASDTNCHVLFGCEEGSM